jgi:hypothetical protein
MGAQENTMTLKERVFLVRNTDSLYNGHPAGNDVREILTRIGAPYEAPPRHTLVEFRLSR